MQLHNLSQAHALTLGILYLGKRGRIKSNGGKQHSSLVSAPPFQLRLFKGGKRLEHTKLQIFIVFLSWGIALIIVFY